jgi:uncharacterized repeat protein (TIGR03803 family)
MPEHVITVDISCSTGASSVAYAFSGRNGAGATPMGGLAPLAGGRFLGATSAGGDYGCGTLYSLDVGGPVPAEQVTQAFQGAAALGTPFQVADPGYPVYPPTLMSNGAYVGTTSEGGSNNGGTLYTMLANGSVTVVHSFAVGADPTSPLLDVNGTYYGTTWSGGSFGEGTFFQYQPAEGLTTLAEFGATNVAPIYPFGRMVLSSENQQIYGVAEGTPVVSSSAGTLGGVYTIAPGSSAISFICAPTSASSPIDPSGGLAAAVNGTMYGLSAYGGSDGMGTLYEVLPSSNTCRVLYNFTGTTADGGDPAGSPLVAADGDLYVQTTIGGANGTGAVVVFSPNGTLLGTLYSFSSGSGPQQPIGALVEGPGASLYGVTSAGGPSNNGTIFRID